MLTIMTTTYTFLKRVSRFQNVRYKYCTVCSNTEFGIYDLKRNDGFFYPGADGHSCLKCTHCSTEFFYKNIDRLINVYPTSEPKVIKVLFSRVRLYSRAIFLIVCVCFAAYAFLEDNFFENKKRKVAAEFNSVNNPISYVDKVE